jgi:predicted RNase H-like nuclease (RuvC/YqgF family)
MDPLRFLSELCHELRTENAKLKEVINTMNTERNTLKAQLEQAKKQCNSKNVEPQPSPS